MITSDMTREEIWKQFLSCGDRWTAWMKHKIDEWHRIEKKQLSKWYGGKVFEWNNRQLNLRMLSVHMRIKNSRFNQAHATYLPVDTYHGVQYYYLNSNTHAIYVYTTHCLKRYAERMGILYSMPTLLAKMGARNPMTLCIYHDPDGKREVYAVRDGILLGEYDAKRDITIMRTFVSNDMLQASQRKAHDIIAQLFPLLDECINAVSKCGSTAMLNALLPLVTCSFQAEAGEIYASYWEES